MLIEIMGVIGLIIILYLTFLEKDLRYVLLFVIGFLAALWVEPSGVTASKWLWNKMLHPFDYMILGIPIVVYLNYAIAASFVVLLTKCISSIKKYKTIIVDKNDKRFACIFIIIGAIMSALIFYGVHRFIGLLFILTGVYLIARNPTMFYVGLLGLSGDFIFEHLYMLAGQLTYTTSYGDVGVGFFLGGTILSAITILIGDRLTVK